MLVTHPSCINLYSMGLLALAVPGYIHSSDVLPRSGGNMLKLAQTRLQAACTCELCTASEMGVMEVRHGGSDIELGLAKVCAMRASCTVRALREGAAYMQAYYGVVCMQPCPPCLVLALEIVWPTLSAWL